MLDYILKSDNPEAFDVLVFAMNDPYPFLAKELLKDGEAQAKVLSTRNRRPLRRSQAIHNDESTESAFTIENASDAGDAFRSSSDSTHIVNEWLNRDCPGVAVECSYSFPTDDTIERNVFQKNDSVDAPFTIENTSMAGDTGDCAQNSCLNGDCALDLVVEDIGQLSIRRQTVTEKECRDSQATSRCECEHNSSETRGNGAHALLDSHQPPTPVEHDESVSSSSIADGYAHSKGSLKRKNAIKRSRFGSNTSMKPSLLPDCVRRRSSDGKSSTLPTQCNRNHGDYRTTLAYERGMGFGFKFVHGSARPRWPGDNQYYVTFIESKGSAFRSQSIKVHDSIVSVNGCDVMSMAIEEVVNLMGSNYTLKLDMNRQARNPRISCAV